MLTVKLFKPAPLINDPYAVQWDIISCERFSIYERAGYAEVVTYKTIPAKEGVSWGLSENTSESYTQCYVENEHGKTIFKHIVTAPSLEIPMGMNGSACSPASRVG